MKLNETVPGIPVWPDIEAAEDGSVVVRGQHVSYEQYTSVKWRQRLVLAVLFVVIGLVAVNMPMPGQGVLVFGLFIIPFFLANVLPTAKWMATFVFPAKTCIRLTPQEITVNGTVYDLSKGVPVQFRANCPYFPQEKYADLARRLEQRKVSIHRLYELQFQRVEMIYGTRPVYITSVDTQEQSQHFALALQFAYDLVKSERAAFPGSAGRPRARQVNAPE